MIKILKGDHMKTLIYATLALVALGMHVSAYADCTTTRIGNTFYQNCSDGVSGTSRQIGNTTYHNFSNGTSGTSRDIGNTTFHDLNNGISGSSRDIGNTTFH